MEKIAFLLLKEQLSKSDPGVLFQQLELLGSDEGICSDAKEIRSAASSAQSLTLCRSAHTGVRLEHCEDVMLSWFLSRNGMGSNVYHPRSDIPTGDL